MSLRTSCPSCRANFLLPETAAGKKVRCTQCGQVFVVKAAGAAAEALPVLEAADDGERGCESPPAGISPEPVNSRCRWG
jgi:predicted Zn finger-like uncharacterized protein